MRCTGRRATLEEKEETEALDMPCDAVFARCFLYIISWEKSSKKESSISKFYPESGQPKKNKIHKKSQCLQKRLKSRLQHCEWSNLLLHFEWQKLNKNVNFNRKKIGVKCQNWKIQMRHFGWLSNAVKLWIFFENYSKMFHTYIFYFGIFHQFFVLSKVPCLVTLSEHKLWFTKTCQSDYFWHF